MIVTRFHSIVAAANRSKIGTGDFPPGSATSAWTGAGKGATQRKFEGYFAKMNAVTIEARLLCHHQEADAFFRLQADDELVRLHDGAPACEDRMGHRPELDEDLRLAAWQPFAGPE